MNAILLGIIVFFTSSCSTISYLYTQGKGQFNLKFDAVKNEKVLKNEKISKEHKEKILLVEKYKSFFYEYFEEKKTSIYSQTVFLKDDAVTYLVIASPKDRIEPVIHKFPIVGSFPYLGFFNLSDAQEFSKKLEKENYSTYIRPVYAYSTLGYFEDRILSSFFFYDDIELASLIFHELFHTIFFIKDEVDFNEALAEHFSDKLLQVYFKDQKDKLKTYEESRLRSLEYAKIVSTASKELRELYKEEGADPQKVLENYLSHNFKDSFRKFCKNSLKCPSDEKWNNARFAAFLTYEEGQGPISKIHEKLNTDLIEFFDFLKFSYKDYKKKKSSNSFLEFLEKEVL